MQLLDFTLNRFFMKLFRTSNMEIVTYCQKFFGCDLPSVTLRKRCVKFIDTNGHTRYFRSSYLSVVVYLFIFIVVMLPFVVK